MEWEGEREGKERKNRGEGREEKSRCSFYILLPVDKNVAQKFTTRPICRCQLMACIHIRMLLHEKVVRTVLLFMHVYNFSDLNITNLAIIIYLKGKIIWCSSDTLLFSFAVLGMRLKLSLCDLEAIEFEVRKQPIAKMLGKVAYER